MPVDDTKASILLMAGDIADVKAHADNNKMLAREPFFIKDTKQLGIGTADNDYLLFDSRAHHVLLDHGSYTLSTDLQNAIITTPNPQNTTVVLPAGGTAGTRVTITRAASSGTTTISAGGGGATLSVNGKQNTGSVVVEAGGRADFVLGENQRSWLGVNTSSFIQQADIDGAINELRDSYHAAVSAVSTGTFTVSRTGSEMVHVVEARGSSVIVELDRALPAGTRVLIYKADGGGKAEVRALSSTDMRLNGGAPVQTIDLEQYSWMDLVKSSNGTSWVGVHSGLIASHSDIEEATSHAITAVIDSGSYTVGHLENDFSQVIDTRSPNDTTINLAGGANFGAVVTIMRSSGVGTTTVVADGAGMFVGGDNVQSVEVGPYEQITFALGSGRNVWIA